LILRQTTNVTAGEVLQIAPDAFHSVSCVSATPSEAIHVYLGPLTQVDRHLYDVENGTVLAYTDENYHHLSQTKN
jgi:predicted metal-dependent enzyme (double-stranded beta helix superfamily)